MARHSLKECARKRFAKHIDLMLDAGVDLIADRRRTTEGERIWTYLAPANQQVVGIYKIDVDGGKTYKIIQRGETSYVIHRDRVWKKGKSAQTGTAGEGLAEFR